MVELRLENAIWYRNWRRLTCCDGGHGLQAQLQVVRVPAGSIVLHTDGDFFSSKIQLGLCQQMGRRLPRASRAKETDPLQGAYMIFAMCESMVRCYLWLGLCTDLGHDRSEFGTQHSFTLHRFAFPLEISDLPFSAAHMARIEYRLVCAFQQGPASVFHGERSTCNV
jgi:hypothetical protein